MNQYKVVHYINQFFGQVGSEEMADYPAEKRQGPVGPGIAFTMAFGDEAAITATIVCGDSWYNENLELAKQTVLDMVREEEPDLFIAGPAFNAGRYGVACGSIADAVQTELGIPAVTGMYVENPGADMYREKVYTVATGDNAAGMRRVVPVMANLGLKLVRRQELGASIEEGYLPNGIRKNFFDQKRGSLRAIEMLLNKLHDKPFVTEYPMPSYDRVAPGPAIQDLSKATIALVTSGGIVPKGNPDHIESSSATRYGSYHLAGVDDLTSETYETAHGGYDPVYANQDADRVVPVDVLRQFEKEGRIGKLHDWFYSTVGNGTSVASSKRFAMEITEKLLAQGVDAVILTST